MQKPYRPYPVVPSPFKMTREVERQSTAYGPSFSFFILFPIRENQRKHSISEQVRENMCNSDEDCRPLGFWLGLPFAFLCLLLSIVGLVVWIVGLLLTCICPCCLCLTVMVELALELVKAPLHVMEWFTSQIPC